MKHPQTLAKNLNMMFPNPDLKIIGDNACCALVLQWVLGIEQDDIDAIRTVQNMRIHKAIMSDCTVTWFDAVPFLTGRTLKDVKKKKITSLKGIKKRTMVLMAKEGNAEGVGHWVGVEKGKIAFNPLEYSVNVQQGKPVEMRELVF